MKIKILIAFLFLTSIGFGQSDRQLRVIGRRTDRTYYTFNVTTETNGKVGDYHLITGDTTTTLSDIINGSQYSRPYMRWWADSLIKFSTNFDDSSDIGIPFDGFTTHNRKFYYDTDSLSIGRTNVIMSYNDEYTNINGGWLSAFGAGSGNLSFFLDRTYIFEYDYYISASNDTTEGIKLQLIGYGEDPFVSYKITKGEWISTADTIKCVDDYIYMRWLEMDGDSSHYYADGVGESFFIDNLTIYEYLGFSTAPLDSAQTLAHPILMTSLIEDYPYYYDASLVPASGEDVYSEGLDSAFYSSFPTPSIFVDEPDTNLILIQIADESVEKVVDTFFVYKTVASISREWDFDSDDDGWINGNWVSDTLGVNGLLRYSSGNWAGSTTFERNPYWGNRIRLLANIFVASGDTVSIDFYDGNFSPSMQTSFYLIGNDAFTILDTTFTILIDTLDPHWNNDYEIYISNQYRQPGWKVYLDYMRIYEVSGSNYALYDTLITSGTFSDEVTQGYWYKALGQATYSSIWAEDSFGEIEVWAEPLTSLLPEFSLPTGLNVIDDTTGCKLTWVKGVGYESVKVHRGLLEGLFEDIDTLLIDIEEFCDSIPTLTENTTYKYRLAAWDGAGWQYTDEALGLAYYNITDSVLVDSSVASIDTTGGYQGPEQLTNGDFASNITSWNLSDCDGLWVETFDGYSGVLKLTVNSANSVYSYQPNVMTVDSIYIVSFDYQLVSANTNVDNFEVRTGTAGDADKKIDTQARIADDAWYSVESDTFKCLSSTYDNIYLYLLQGESSTGLNVGDVIYFDNISVRTGDGAGSIDTTWSYEYNYTLTDFDCAAIPVIVPPQVTGLAELAKTSSWIVINWDKIDTTGVGQISGYKVERKLTSGAIGVYDYIYYISGESTSADYSNDGENLTEWSLSVETNSVTSEPTGGNTGDNWYYNFLGGTDRVAATRDFAYDDSMWISFDYYCEGTYLAGNGLLSTIFRIFHTDSDPIYTFNLNGNGQSIPNRFGTEVENGATTYSTDGFALDSWISIIAGVDAGDGDIVIYANGNQVANYSGESFDGLTISGIRFGTWGNGTIPPASSYWRYDNIKIAADSSSLFGTVSDPDTTLYISPLVSNTAYTFRVRAYNNAGNGAYSDTLSITTLLISVDAPTNLDTSVTTTTTATITWTEAVGDSTIGWWADETLTWTRFAVANGIETFLIEGLSAGTNYSLYLQTKNGETYSLPTAPFAFVTRGAPTPPTVEPPTNFVSSGNDTTNIYYTWTESVTASSDHYLYWKKQLDSIYDSILVTNEADTIGSLSKNTLYNAYMKAFNGGDVSPSTSGVNVTTDAGWQPPGSSDITLYGTPNGAGNGNGQTPENAATLEALVSMVVAGDIVSLSTGTYQFGNSGSQSTLSWNIDGTEENPIIWIGTISAADLTLGIDGKNTSSSSTGVNSTKICTDRTVNNGPNPTFSFNAKYNEYHKMVFQEDYSQKQLGSIGDTYITFDSVAFKYPSNVQSSNNHLMRTSQSNITFEYCHMYNSPRTFMWASWYPTGSRPDYLTYDHCTFTGHDSHPAFQVFPYTNNTTGDLSPAYGTTITNNTFIEIGFADAIYLRHNSEFRIIGNQFIDVDRPIGLPMHAYNGYGGEVVDTSGGGLILFNTHVVYGNGGFFIANEGTQRLTIKNNIVLQAGSGELLGDRILNFHSFYDNQAEPPNVGMDVDYNLYYLDYDPSFSEGTFRFPYSNTNENSYSLTQWRSSEGQDLNSTGSTRPTFLNEGSQDFRPLNGSSPQVGNGTWNWRWGVIVDMNGTTIDSTNVTIGAFQ